MNWLLENTIFLSIHGSQSFGLSTDTSDLDLKGVCIPPANVRNDLFHKFEQGENQDSVLNLIKDYHYHLINPKNPKVESVIYSLDKFIRLCALVNPTILELLWMPEQFVLIKNKLLWGMLTDNRKIFLTKKVRVTYAGYAKQQLAKIQRHRKYLTLEKEPKRPERKDFGLNTENISREYGEIDAYIRREVEKWNFANYNLDQDDRFDLKEDCWDCVRHLNMAADVDWPNWPEAYWKAGFVKLQNLIGLDKDVLKLVMAEKNYNDALKLYKGYEHWKNERNPERKEMERKFELDCKHASHLVRLYRTGVEALRTGEIQVLRSDADELRAIRNGAWPYEKVIDFADEMEQTLADAEKSSSLPSGMNKVAINDLYHNIIELSEHYL